MFESSDQPGRWRAVAPDELLWAHWGGDFVVFHRPSGLTHLVNGATAQLLRHVLTEPQFVADAAMHLASIEGASAGPDFIADIQQLLMRLESLGLVERVAA